jgi:hypothetical protein
MASSERSKARLESAAGENQKASGDTPGGGLSSPRYVLALRVKRVRSNVALAQGRSRPATWPAYRLGAQTKPEASRPEPPSRMLTTDGGPRSSGVAESDRDRARRLAVIVSSGAGRRGFVPGARRCGMRPRIQHFPNQAGRSATRRVPVDCQRP